MKRGANFVEQPLHRLALEKIGQGAALVGQRPRLAEAHHLLYDGLHRLGLGQGGGHAVLLHHAGGQVAQQGAAVGGVAPQLVSVFAVSHVASPP